MTFKFIKNPEFIFRLCLDPSQILYYIEQIEDLLEYNTAAATGWRCPEHLYPGASARRALRHGGGAVGHELSVVLVDDLGTKEVRLSHQHTSGAQCF